MKSRNAFLAAGQALLARAPNIPDPYARKIVTEGMQWAIANPDAFSTHIEDKVNRNMHSPNLVAFTNLLDGLERTSKLWKSPVREIVHDEQSEFRRTFFHWHEVISHPQAAMAEPIHWLGEEEPVTLSRAPGSVLRMATEETSPGLQVIDIVLWLFKRLVAGQEVGVQSSRLLNRVFSKGHQNDFSFDGVGHAVETKLEEIWNLPVTPEQQARAAEFLAKSEERRRANLAAYEATKRQ